MTQSTIIPINYIERKPHSSKYRIVGKGVTVEFLATLLNHPDWTVERSIESARVTTTTPTMDTITPHPCRRLHHAQS